MFVLRCRPARRSCVQCVAAAESKSRQGPRRTNQLKCVVSGSGGMRSHVDHIRDDDNGKNRSMRHAYQFTRSRNIESGKIPRGVDVRRSRRTSAHTVTTTLPSEAAQCLATRSQPRPS